MNYMKIPLAIGSVFWVYFLYRAGKFLLTNSLHLGELFRLMMIVFLLIVFGCCLAFFWIEPSAIKKETPNADK